MYIEKWFNRNFVKSEKRMKDERENKSSVLVLTAVYLSFMHKFYKIKLEISAKLIIFPHTQVFILF